jgi:hypothetical protein
MLLTGTIIGSVTGTFAQVASPFGGSPVPLPGTVQAENFDNGGSGVAYFDVTAGNRGGAYRTTDVDIEASSDSGGGYNVGWTRAGEWLKYTVNVATAGTYTLQARVAAPSAGGTFHVEFGGVDKTGSLTIPGTGGWQSWTTLSKSVTLSAGTQVVRIVFDAAGPGGVFGNLNWLSVGTSAPSTTTTLFRQPYLQQVTSSSAVIVWATRTAGRAEVRYQAPAQSPRTVSATSTLFAPSRTGMSASYYQHVARLTTLSPLTEYTYDVLLDGTDLTSITDRFRTAPQEGTGAVRFIAFGDSGIGSSGQRQLAGRMLAETFDLVLHGGDVTYGSASTWGGGTHQTLHDWFFEIYKDWLRRRPVFPAIGNHDDQTSFGLPYRDVFVLPENGVTSGYSDHAERFYSFDYGPVHFVALDTERAFQDPLRRQAQITWLQNDLAATAQPWRVAFFHRSPHSNGVEHGSDLAVRQAFGPLFERYGVQLVISAHDHDFERSVPWRQTTTAGGQAVTYVVSGGGGARLYGVARAASTARSLSAFHYVRTNVAGCTLQLEAVGLDGVVFDSYTLDRCAQARDAQPPTIAITSPAGGSSLSGVITVAATATDDVRVEKVDFWLDGYLFSIDRTAPYAFAWDTRTSAEGSHRVEVRAYDMAGRITSGSRTVQVTNGPRTEMVLYTSDTTLLSGNWVKATSTTGAGGAKLVSTDLRWSAKDAPLAKPRDFVEMRFDAPAGVDYRLWVRLRAGGNLVENDSVWVQFSDAVTSAGAPLWRIGSTSALAVALEDCSGCGVSGWGWQDNHWRLSQSSRLTFATSGPHTIRIQTREDGIDIDQVVLSSSTYLNTAPGAVKNDTTIVPK